MKHILIAVAILGISRSIPSQINESAELQAKVTEACRGIEQIAKAEQPKHPHDVVESWCSLSYRQKPADRVPEKRIPLSSGEIVALRHLRAVSTAAFEAQGAYEKYVMAKHGYPDIPVTTPCWHFRGIIVDDDFITDEPNSWPGCDATKEPTHER